MATVRKNGKKWRAGIRIKNPRTSKNFQTKLEAQSWAVEKEILFGHGGDILHGKTLKDAYSKYAREVSSTKRGARWEIIRIEKLSRQPLAEIQLDILTSEDIKQWMKDCLQTISPSSVKRELQIISSVIEKSLP